MTFKQLETLYETAFGYGFVGDRTLANRIATMMESARVNADDTVYVEKDAPPAEYDAVAMASIVGILSYSDDTESAAWFRDHGVRW